jgi:hypothetical protein
VAGVYSSDCKRKNNQNKKQAAACYPLVFILLIFVVVGALRNKSGTYKVLVDGHYTLYRS